jgi:hypothetical protein
VYSPFASLTSFAVAVFVNEGNADTVMLKPLAKECPTDTTKSLNN